MWALKILIWWSSLVSILAENTSEYMANGGILVINDPRLLNILSENVVIPIKLDIEIYNSSFPKFITHLEALKEVVGKNLILEELIIKAKLQSKVVDSFFRNYIKSLRTKRQLSVMVGGIATLLAMGFTETQILNLKREMTNIKSESDQMSNKMHIIQNVLEYNSKKLRKLELMQSHILNVLKSSLKL